MLNDQDSNMAANAICTSATLAEAAWREAAYEYTRPSVVFKPKLSKDGNQWCALLGDDLQSGVAGFGDSPAEAMWDFDKAMNKKLPS